MKEMTRANVKILREEMDQALAEVGKHYGVKFQTGSIRFYDKDFHVKVECHILNTAGLSEAKKEDFELYCRAVGLKPEHFNQTFTSQNEVYRITGINLRAKKYPINAVRVRDDREFKFPAHTIQRKLSSAEV